MAMRTFKGIKVSLMTEDQLRTAVYWLMNKVDDLTLDRPTPLERVRRLRNENSMPK